MKNTLICVCLQFGPAIVSLSAAGITPVEISNARMAGAARHGAIRKLDEPRFGQFKTGEIVDNG